MKKWVGATPCADLWHRFLQLSSAPNRDKSISSSYFFSPHFLPLVAINIRLTSGPATRRRICLSGSHAILLLPFWLIGWWCLCMCVVHLRVSWCACGSHLVGFCVAYLIICCGYHLINLLREVGGLTVCVWLSYGGPTTVCVESNLVSQLCRII